MFPLTFIVLKLKHCLCVLLMFLSFYTAVINTVNFMIFSVSVFFSHHDAVKRETDSSGDDGQRDRLAEGY